MKISYCIYNIIYKHQVIRNKAILFIGLFVIKFIQKIDAPESAEEHGKINSLSQQALADLTQVVKSRQTDTRKKLLASIRQDISNKTMKWSDTSGQ